MDEFNTALNSNQYVLIYYYANWDAACKEINSSYESLPTSFKNVKFFKVNSDTADEICDPRHTSVLPTFEFFKDSVMINTLKECSANDLESNLKQMQVMFLTLDNLMFL